MHKPSKIEIYASERFLKAYQKASIPLQNLAAGAIHDFIGKFYSDPKTVLHHYGRLAHIPSVLEIDLSGGPRLLARFEENCLTMLDMGNHEIVPRYSYNMFITDLESRRAAPTTFWPYGASKFFFSLPDPSITLKYRDEVLPDWIYFLENQQGQVFDTIANKALSVLDKRRSLSKHFIIGGPGTGKTCILLNLLKYFVDFGYEVGIEMSNNLVSYVEKSLAIDLSLYRVNLSTLSQRKHILLIDDPSNLEWVLLQCKGRARVIVIAFDPLQLEQSIADHSFKEIEQTNKVVTHVLFDCYRQKENLGKQTKHIMQVIANSTPFLALEKIQTFKENHEQLTELANSLSFLNPHGYIEHYPNATTLNIQDEVRRILNAKSLMWQHWPGLLVLLDDCQLTEESYKELQPLINRKYVKELPLDKVTEVKGLEFQHVFIFIKKKRFEEIQNGFRGTGQQVYNQRRLLRIPFSRAKDSIVIFAIDNQQA